VVSFLSRKDPGIAIKVNLRVGEVAV